MRWAGNITCIGVMRSDTVFLLENLKRRERWEYLGIEGKIILEWI
jgi:hypothetical protein